MVGVVVVVVGVVVVDVVVVGVVVVVEVLVLVAKSKRFTDFTQSTALHQKLL